jgi:hypothetical protein
MKCDEHKISITFTLSTLCETKKTDSFLLKSCFVLDIFYLYDSEDTFPIGISKHPVVQFNLLSNSNIHDYCLHRTVHIITPVYVTTSLLFIKQHFWNILQCLISLQNIINVKICLSMLNLWYCNNTTKKC